MIDDLASLDRIATGDAEAFAEWLSSAEAPLRRSLRSFARTVDTEAVLQEALLRVWNGAPRVRPDGRPDPLLRFALRVARNLAISETRRWGGRPPSAGLEAAEVVPSPEDPADPLLLKLIQGCAEELPPKPRQALWSRIGAKGGVSDVELAELLGMTKNTFLKNFGRARAFMADCLERVGAGRAS